MLEAISHHSELMYHPNSDILSAYIEFFHAKGIEAAQKLNSAFKSNNML